MQDTFSPQWIDTYPKKLEHWIELAEHIITLYPLKLATGAFDAGMVRKEVPDEVLILLGKLLHKEEHVEYLRHYDDLTFTSLTYHGDALWKTEYKAITECIIGISMRPYLFQVKDMYYSFHYTGFPTTNSNPVPKEVPLKEFMQTFLNTCFTKKFNRSGVCVNDQPLWKFYFKTQYNMKRTSTTMGRQTDDSISTFILPEHFAYNADISQCQCFALFQEDEQNGCPIAKRCLSGNYNHSDTVQFLEAAGNANLNAQPQQAPSEKMSDTGRLLDRWYYLVGKVAEKAEYKFNFKVSKLINSFFCDCGNT